MELFLLLCTNFSWQPINFDYLAIFGFLKDFVVLVGGIIALINYLAQTNQRKIDNGYKSLQRFRENVPSEDIEVWKKVCKNSRESMKHQTKDDKSFFVLDKDGNEKAVRLSQLFMLEGKGLLVPNSRWGTSEEVRNLSFSGIRNIADQLNVIGYEFLNGQISAEVIYYEIGEIMDSIYQWLQDAESGSKERYRYFLKMYSTNSKKLREIPKKINVFFC